MATSKETPSGNLLEKILENPERGNYFVYHRTDLDEAHVVQVAHDEDLDMMPPSTSHTRLCIVLAQTGDKVLVYDVASNALQRIGGHNAWFNYETKKLNEVDLVHSLTLEEFRSHYGTESGITIVPDTANEGPHQHTDRISDFLVKRWMKNGSITEEDENEDLALMYALAGIVHGHLCNVLNLMPSTDGEYEKKLAIAQQKMMDDAAFLKEISELQAARDDRFRPRIEEWCRQNLEFWKEEGLT